MRIAIYARKSTESEDRQVQSLEDQIRFLTELAQREKLIVVEIFQESKSAKEPGRRPEYDRLVADIQSGRIEGILTWSIDRLSRNQLEGGQIAYLLSSGKLSVIRTADRIYRPEDSALLMAVETGMATAFIQNLSRNVKRGLQGKFERGWHVAKAPLGYKNDAESLEIAPDPDRFDVVREAWDMLLSGEFTVSEISRVMQERGLTKWQRRGIQPPISRNTFDDVFKNRFYVGEIKMNGMTRQGKHVPMITEDEFAKAQRVLQGLKHRPRKHNLAIRLKGAFTCATCGCAIVGEQKVKTFPRTGRTVTYTYYHCSGRRGCSTQSIREEDLVAAIAKFADSMRVSKRYLEWLSKALGEAIERRFHHDESDQSSNSEVDKLTQRLDGLVALRADGEIGNGEFARIRASIVERISEIEKRTRQSGTRLLEVSAQAQKHLQTLREISMVSAKSHWEDGLIELAKNLRAVLSIGGSDLIQPDLAIQKLAALEPVFSGSQSDKFDAPQGKFPTWYTELEEIVNLIEIEVTQ